MNKKEERIFITDNPLYQSELKYKVMQAFEKAKKVETLIKDFGITLTRDIVRDSLTLRRDTEQRPVEGTTKWVGEKSEAQRFAHEFEAVEVWRNATHLEAAFNALLDSMSKESDRVADTKARAEALRRDFEKLLVDIYALFHINALNIETKDFLRFFDVADGNIVLPADIDDRLRAETATYATTETGIAACHLHREIAEKLNTLADMMKAIPRFEFFSNLPHIFIQSEDDTITAAPIDYDIFTK